MRGDQPDHLIERRLGQRHDLYAARQTFRIREHGVERQRRDQAKRRLAEWFHSGEYQRGGAAMQFLLIASLGYSVPPCLLADLVETVYVDVVDRFNRERTLTISDR